MVSAPFLEMFQSQDTFKYNYSQIFYSSDYTTLYT